MARCGRRRRAERQPDPPDRRDHAHAAAGADRLGLARRPPTRQVLDPFKLMFAAMLPERFQDPARAP